MKTNRLSNEQLQGQYQALRTRFDAATPAERQAMAGEIRELAKTAFAEYQHDAFDWNASVVAYEKAHHTAKTKAEDMVALAKLQNREQFGLLGALIPVGYGSRLEAAQKEERVSELQDERGVRGDELVGGRGVVAGLAEMLVEVSAPANVEQLTTLRDSLMRRNTHGSSYGATVAAAALGSNVDVKTFRELRDALTVFDNAESDVGAALGAALMCQAGVYVEPAMLRDLAVKVTKYSSGTASSGGAIAAAILASAPGFDAARDVAKLKEVRDGLQHYSGNGSASGATIAAALLITNPKFDATRDLPGVRKLSDSLMKYSGQESSGAASLGAALVFGAKDFDPERDLERLIGARESLLHFTSERVVAAAIVGAALAVRAGGAAGADAVRERGSSAVVASMPYSGENIAAGAVVTAGLLAKRGKVEDDSAAVRQFEGSLRKFSHHDSMAGALIASAAVIDPSTARDSLLGAALFSVFEPEDS